MSNANPRDRFERRWRKDTLPIRQLIKAPTDRTGFDFTGAMHELITDIALTTPEFASIDPSRILITAIINRSPSSCGVQARLTPMRFKNGALTTRRRNTLYGLQRYYVNDVEMLYLLTFVLPRFLSQPFGEKLATVFHELYHISPAFDGDFRRLRGRCCVHSKSKESFHNVMRKFASDYRGCRAEFLRGDFRQFQEEHGGLRVIIVPQPRLVPISIS